MTEVIIQEQLLECAICMERLDENCKMLPCQHTYCRTCLERIYEHERILNCPQCRKSVPNTDVGNPIDALPTNFVLLTLIDQVKRNPFPRPRDEDGELQAAITNSIEDFQKEKTAGMLLKHNEQLQTQLAMESSKREILLKNAQNMSEEYNELFQSQRSHDEAVFRKESQSLHSEKEKLEVEVAILKSEQENPDYVIDLISWFEINCNQFTEELKKKAQDALKNLRRAKITQNNNSLQKRLNTILDNLALGEELETYNKMPGPVKKDVSDQYFQNSEIVVEINEKFNEIKNLLKIESVSKKSNLKAEVLNLSQAHRPQSTVSAGHSHSPQQSHPIQHQFSYNYLPPPLMSVPAKPGFMPNVYHRPYYGPYHFPPSPLSPAQTFDSRFYPHPEILPSSNQCKTFECGTSGKKHGKSNYHLSTPPTDPKKFNKSVRSKAEDRKNDLNQSLILPDIRDYDRFEKNFQAWNIRKKYGIRDSERSTKIHELACQLPTSSSGEVGEPLLMLPDIRHYEKVYSNFRRSTSSLASEERRNNSDSLGCNRSDEKKESSDNHSYKYIRRRGKSNRGQDKNRDSGFLKPILKTDDGFESDSSVTSITSISSNLSTRSTPAEFHKNKRFPSYRGKNRCVYNQNFHRKPNADLPKEKSVENQVDNLKKLIYPSRKEARIRKLDVKKPFETAMLCLGKNGKEPVSEKVKCLADIYAFEEKYSDCQLIHY